MDGLRSRGLAVSTWRRRSARRGGEGHPRSSACCVKSQASKHTLSVLPQRPDLGGPAGAQRRRGLARWDPRMKMNPSSGSGSQVNRQREQRTKTLSSASSSQAPMNCLLKQALIFELQCSSLHCECQVSLLLDSSILHV